MEWFWALLALILGVLSVVQFLLYRQARMALAERSEQDVLPPVEEVAALLHELQDAGETIIGRLEAKQEEAEGLLRLLDAKLNAVQMAMEAHATWQDTASANKHKVAEPQLPDKSQAQTINPPSDKHLMVKSLHESGLDPVEIARQTGLRPDEVRLIISLYMRNKHCNME